MPEVKKIIINENISGQRLDNFLLNHLKGVPKSKIYSIIRKGEIRVNSKRKKPSYKLAIDDEVRVPPIKTSSKENQFVPSNIIALLRDSIVEENDDYIALNKPDGIASHGGSGISIGVIETIRNFGKSYRDAKLVHRLDKDTSGVFIIAKNRESAQLLTSLFRLRKVHKTYLAICQGEITNNSGTWEDDLIRYDGDKKVIENAKTIYKVLDKNSEASLLELKPITGRKHQLRKQLYAIGNPIFGDTKYKLSNSNKGINKNLMLHSYQIKFKINNIKHTYSALLPDYFKRLLKSKRLRFSN